MFENTLFLASALLTVGGAIAVVCSKNLMHACIFLLTSFLGIAGLYLTLSADFIAATQLMVYVGGVVILMVFAVMLTGGSSADKMNNLGISKIPGMGSLNSYIWGGASAAVLLLIIGKVLSNIFANYKAVPLQAYESTVEKIGMLLVTDHVLAFEISSVLLLGALIGAAIVARPKKLR